jgi:hypothetical protein
MIKNISHLTDNFFNQISNFVSIVDSFELFRYLRDFDLLKKRLLETKKQSYSREEYYLISHYDTDYYLPNCPYGLGIFNLVKTFREVDISTGRIIFVTNHPNQINEFKHLIPNNFHNFELPVVIDDCISAFKLSNIDNIPFDDIDFDIDAGLIEFHALAMMNRLRLHRSAIANHIQDNKLTDKIALSYSLHSRSIIDRNPNES